MANYEFSLSREYLNKIKQKEDDIKHYVVSCALPQDEYLVNVGYHKALMELRLEFQELMKQYFPVA